MFNNQLVRLAEVMTKQWETKPNDTICYHKVESYYTVLKSTRPENELFQALQNFFVPVETLCLFRCVDFKSQRWFRTMQTRASSQLNQRSMLSSWRQRKRLRRSRKTTLASMKNNAQTIPVTSLPAFCFCRN